jgi:hypothetical protein
MTNTKFVVKVVRGARAAQYVQRIDRSPVQTTLKRNLALVMGKFTAEDVVKSLENSRCISELVPVLSKSDGHEDQHLAVTKR